MIVGSGAQYVYASFPTKHYHVHTTPYSGTFDISFMRLCITCGRTIGGVITGPHDRLVGLQCFAASLCGCSLLFLVGDLYSVLLVMICWFVTPLKGRVLFETSSQNYELGRL